MLLLLSANHTKSMKQFLNEDFLLNTKTACTLYHQYAESLPIIDYHCHLPPAEIADNRQFENISQIWLYGDHYKWRAMRANGVNEAYITGSKTDKEKFQMWAATVPYTLRNPLYHWTHLELQRYFGITKLLSPDTADSIYDECNEKLQSPEFSVRSLLKKFKVEVVGTTDDPLDNLSYHQKIRSDNFGVKVLPSFRPDKAMNADNVPLLNSYIDSLEQIAGVSINNIDEYLAALKTRHDYFAENGGKLSDHGLDHIYASDYTDEEIAAIFMKIRSGALISEDENLKFKSAMLYHFALWDHEKGWVQQYHIGALRNNNTRALATLGPDTGWDSIGDFTHGKSLSRFLDKLDTDNRLAKTILYNSNPMHNDLFAAMAGNFNDGSVAGKVQFGSAWWFMDQKQGMIDQLNSLSNIGLLSQLVGMLTDSRSFMSFPRHEYFRRILCNLLGDDIENGELPNDVAWAGKIVENICYNNAREYFGFYS